MRFFSGLSPVFRNVGPRPTEGDINSHTNPAIMAIPTYDPKKEAHPSHYRSTVSSSKANNPNSSNRCIRKSTNPTRSYLSFSGHIWEHQGIGT
ncbi:hypothetical protein AVEN_42201-1 [Araneus ventricosus]|uniref:Uncharacterized protein n=1 Tax=Araneus ventricosus TaxID=182803 RepID=A0A4Y2B1J3_ARAVE|nr:hypothetical protein AVEN_42201-1 [Araneus ventricosus]